MNRLQLEVHRLYTPQAPEGQDTDPGEPSLLDVMNDDTVALGLRIEAAKALLPCSSSSGGDDVMA